MEIRLKYSYSGLLLFIIVTVGFIVAGFLFSYIFWIFAGFWGIFVALSILNAIKYGDDAIVISGEGVWVDGVFEIDWSEVDHCYVSIRTGENPKERTRTAIVLVPSRYYEATLR